MSHPFKTTSAFPTCRLSFSKQDISLIHTEINNYRNYLHAYLWDKKEKRYFSFLKETLNNIFKNIRQN